MGVSMTSLSILPMLVVVGVASIAILSRPTTFVTVRMLLTVVISLVVVVVRMTAL